MDLDEGDGVGVDLRDDEEVDVEELFQLRSAAAPPRAIRSQRRLLHRGQVMKASYSLALSHCMIL